MSYVRNKDEGTLPFKTFEQKSEVEVVNEMSSTVYFKSVTILPTFEAYSFEELKLIDYNYKCRANGVNRVFGVNPPERLANNVNAYGIAQMNLPAIAPIPFASNNGSSNGVNPFNTTTNWFSPFVSGSSNPLKPTNSSNPFALNGNSTNTMNTANNSNTFNSNNGNPFNANLFNNTYAASSDNHFPFNIVNANARAPQINNPFNLNSTTTGQSTNPFNTSSSFNAFNQPSTNAGANPFNTSNPINTSSSNPFSPSYANSQVGNPFVTSPTSTNPFNTGTNPFNTPSSPAVQGSNPFSCKPFSTNPFSNCDPAGKPQSGIISTFDRHINQLNELSYENINALPSSLYYPFLQHNADPFQFNPFLAEKPAHASSWISSIAKTSFKLKAKPNAKEDDDYLNLKQLTRNIEALFLKKEANQKEDCEKLQETENELFRDIHHISNSKQKGHNAILRTLKLNWLNKPTSGTSSIITVSFNANKISLRDIKSYLMKQLIHRKLTSFYFLLNDILLYKDKDRQPLEEMKDIVNDEICFEIKKRESRGVSIDLLSNCLNKDKGTEPNDQSNNVEEEEDNEEEEEGDKSYLPIITTLSTNPSQTELAKMSKKQLSQLSNFSIFNENGCIVFLSPVDLTYLNIDNIVSITPLKINVYSNETPPQPGEKLNQRALIEINNIDEDSFPSDMSLTDTIKSYLKESGGTFVSLSNGLLKFTLDSFSS